MKSNTTDRVRLYSIDCLRGIAALAVTFFHLTGSSGLSSKTAFYGQYGWLGVQMFFVISGFILPYSLHKKDYHIQDFGIFILKRFIRIYPAYVIAILIGIVLALITNRLNNNPYELLGHLFLINDIAGYNWISPVFWTLAIEFQFYFLIGLIYPYLKNNISILLAVWVPSLCSIVITESSFIFHWYPLFCIGMLFFFWQLNRFSYRMLIVNLILLLSFIAYSHNIPSFLAAFGLSLFLLIPSIGRVISSQAVLLFAGKISYSLYLVHWELGRATVNVCRRIPFLGDHELVRVFLGLTVSLSSAWILYQLVEKPSLKMSTALKYVRRE